MPRIPSTPNAQTLVARPRNTAPSTARTASAPASALDLSTDAIRLRAFQIYERRGRQPGREAEDWEQARRELAEEQTATLRRA